LSDHPTSFEVFVDDSEPLPAGVGIVLHGASIVESDEGELAPGCKLTPEQALSLSAALVACAQVIDTGA
jgi:hypothetical protein